MQNYTVVIRTPNGQPSEAVVRAVTVQDAIRVAREMGRDVDEEQTLALEKQDEGRPGRVASIVAILLTLIAWAYIEAGVGAIVLAAIAVERSRGRRGLAALVLAFIVTIAGQAFWIYREMNP
jgi:hypothetical protein